ncbi:hypothetical protein ACFWVC_12115 [Streptomyces sp. NPDC058691]|uniref:hypothetical protein n=1 Tax=Streptomyces sp. NPDC058691 TaxID=3346601 RepID=UPI003659F946
MSRPVVAGIGSQTRAAGGTRPLVVTRRAATPAAAANATRPDNENSGPRRPPRNGETDHAH